MKISASIQAANQLNLLEDIENNKQYLESLKNKSASEWRDFATQCMVEIVDNKK